MQQKYDFSVWPAKQARNLEVFSVDKAVNQSGCEDDDSVSQNSSGTFNGIAWEPNSWKVRKPPLRLRVAELGEGGVSAPNWSDPVGAARGSSEVEALPE